MTIVIPYKDEVLKGLELKYALRSIEKNLTGWDKIFLIGEDLPPLRYGIGEKHENKLRDIEAQCPDFPGRKEYSVYKKLLAACDEPLISENFVYWNDDHFLLKPLDVSEIKYWHDGPLAKEVENPANTFRWRTAAQNTLARFPNALNFDIHTPIIFNKYRFKQIFQNEKEELVIKSLYCNYRGRSDTYELEGEFMEDCNISSILTYEQIKQAIEGKLFCSSKGGITKEYFRILEELFPEPSKFEL